jgi:hypothetical protein
MAGLVTRFLTVEIKNTALKFLAFIGTARREAMFHTCWK